MTLVTVEDALDDKQIRSAMSDGLAADLEKAWHEASESGRKVRARRQGYDVVVSPHGDIDPEITDFGGFANWVGDAGELALHVGPTHDPHSGQSIVELLDVGGDGEPRGGDDDAGEDEEVDVAARWTPAGPPLHWPEWSPRRFPDAGQAPDLTVAESRPVWAFRCDTCGVASSDATDFEPTSDPERRRCHCGGDATRTLAVMCDSCDTLILLHGSDPVSTP